MEEELKRKEREARASEGSLWSGSGIIEEEKDRQESIPAEYDEEFKVDIRGSDSEAVASTSRFGNSVNSSMT